MLMVRKEEMSLFSLAVWILCAKARLVSKHEEWEHPLNWLWGMRLCFPKLNMMCQAAIFLMSLPRRSISWMGQWDLGRTMYFLLFLGMTATRDIFHDLW